ncbi:MAG: nucleotidyltransferase domain-containing protein [Phascolarctobacterium sp.]|nr:nucleotidyltransferase domain-containing protein [Candidatus Phascolarctobacterium caballi]
MDKQSCEKLRLQIADVIEKYKLNKVILFGSRARGDNQDNSDYDFYIDAPNLKSLLQFGIMVGDMKKALQSNVDIVLFPDEYTKVQPYLLEAIQKDGVMIYG